MEAQNRTLELFEPLDSFSKVMLDAFVIVDQQGKVLKNNALFTALTHKSSKQIKRAANLDELLTLSLGGKPLPIKDLIKRTQIDRLDEIQADNGKRSDLVVILGYYPIIEPNDQSVAGAFLLIRDVTAEAGLQTRFETSEKRATTDPLTGLHTRGFFEDQLNLQVHDLLNNHREQELQSLSIALLDIDHFKKVNDVYGHQTGDEVLKIVAQIMKESFRKTDILCRYGGEEFLVILQGTTLEQALRPLENFRSKVAAQVIDFKDQQFHITVSCGVAQLRIGEENYEETIGRADQALYASKEKGRNLISAHTGTNIRSREELLEGS